MTFINYKIKEHRLKRRGYTVTDERDHVFATFKRKPFSFKAETNMYDEHHKVIFTITRKVFSFNKEHYIHDQNNELLFRIFRPMGFKKDIFVESMTEPEALYIQGNLWKSEYAFYKNNVEITYVTRKFWSIADTYRVSILANENNALMIALTIVLDSIKDAGKK